MANPLTNRKFIHFNRLENFENQLQNNPGSILDTQIVFIKDARKIWTHGTYYTLDERITDDIYSKLEALAGISADIIQKLDEAQFIAAGPTAERPTGEELQQGICYLDTDLNEPIWWGGTNWIDAVGNNADLPHSGTTAQKPNIANVKIGFDYLDTTTGQFFISDGTKWIHIADSVISDITYSNNKIRKTDNNGNTTDVVTVSQLKTDMALNNVGNFKAVSTEANQSLTDTEKNNARTNIGAIGELPGNISYFSAYSDETVAPVPGEAIYTKSEVDEALSDKQDIIDDLADIRSGAQAGSTAVQQSTLDNVINNLYNDDITDITSRFVVAETGKKIYEGTIVSQSNSLYTQPVHFEKGQTIKVTLNEVYSAYHGVAILSYENEDNEYISLVNLSDSPLGFSFEYTFLEEHDVIFSITRPTLAAKIELYQDAVLKPDVDEVKPYKYFYTKWLKYSINAIPNVGETFNPENIRYHDSVSTYRRTYAECKEGDVFYFGKTYGKNWIITDENFVVLKKMVVDVLEEYIEIPKDGKYLFCQVNKVPTEQYPHILYKKCTQEEYKDLYVSTSQMPIEATMIETFYPPRPKMGWNMSGNVGDIFDYSYLTTTGCAYSLDVKTGDIFYLTNHIYSDVNYLVLDSYNRIIKKVVSSFNRWWLIDYKIEIPEGGTKLLWNGDSDCILESETGFGVVSLKDESVLPNIVKRVINNSGEGTTRRFCLSWASDTHNDVIRYKRFIDFTNKHQGCFDVVLHTGDGNRMSDQDKGFEKTVNTYKPNGYLMFAIGNHDAHGQAKTSGIRVLSSGSRLWNGENYCAKFFDESTVYSADKCNFYRDFASSKIRIIVLNDYDCPRYASSTNWVTITDETEIASAVDWVAGTTYQVGDIINYKGLYLKCLVQSKLEESGTVWSEKQTYALSRFNVDCVYWSQEKINFFINALNVEQGWSIIVASHCPMEPLPSDSNKVIEKWTYRKNNTIPSINVKYGQNGYVLQDILTAYLNRTTINQTYKAITPNSVPSSGSLINQETYLPDVIVNADFTSAIGDVVCYLHGHQHCDSAFYSDHMSNLKFLTIGNINNTYKPMDRHEPWFSGDIIKGEDSRDSFNLLSIDTTEKKVYIVRVGADMTDDLSVRDYMGISYAHT